MLYDDDFNYITDENYLNKYWLEEPVTCHHCHGSGVINSTNQGKDIVCPHCHGTGLIKRKEQMLVMKLRLSQHING